MHFNKLLGVILGVLASSCVGSEAHHICYEIESRISNLSGISYPDTASFEADIYHFFNSSSQEASCVLEVGSPEDVAVAIRLIGKSRTPFALHSGGHASNTGFSSTTGVHISFARLNKLVLSADKSTVEIGMGMLWLDVYEQLNGTGYNVLGGRTVGPGVGGFTLGGGYSWKTNQYGMVCDMVKQFNLNGTITSASATMNPDVFFALKGGLNRFGVVTSAEYYTVPQVDLVYAGYVYYDASVIDAVLNATSIFTATNTDDKAQLFSGIFGSAAGYSAFVSYFYDGPSPGASFAAFDAIPYVSGNNNTQSFYSFVAWSVGPDKTRGTFSTLPTSGFSLGYLSAIKNEIECLNELQLARNNVSDISYVVQPFTNYGRHATDSAYPHSLSPMLMDVTLAWERPEDDDFFHAALKASIGRLKDVAIAEGIFDEGFTLYPNYATWDTSAEELYGETNAARLRVIQDEIDPGRVMYLAGGFML